MSVLIEWWAIFLVWWGDGPTLPSAERGGTPPEVIESGWLWAQALHGLGGGARPEETP